MVEFDTPGHAASWCTGYPEVCPSPSCLEPLNPSTEATFTLISSLFNEVTGGAEGAGLFPEDLLHLGGDEVDTSCWSSSPSITAWMQQQGFTTEDAYLYFVNRTVNIALAQGRHPVNWQEVYDHFTTELDPKCIVHAWNDPSVIPEATANGYRVLNSYGWYLDHLTDSWESYYVNDPAQGITDPTQKTLVMGGEACMWGETVDPSDWFNTVWPRAAAVAERLWSAESVNSPTAAQSRYYEFRCLLDRRGIGAAPSGNLQARQPPGGPGSCLKQ